MVILAPRPDFTKREGSPCPKKWGSLASGSADGPLAADSPDWPLAAHSAPAPAPAATPASAAACFRNRLRPDGLESMIASRDPEFPICALSAQPLRRAPCEGPTPWPECLRQP